MLDTQSTKPMGGGVSPTYHPLEPVQCVAFADTKLRKKHMRHAFSLGLKRFPEIQAPVGADVAIVAGGPSLNETYKEISKFRNVIVCGSAHDHAVRLGIRPTYAIECDPTPEQIDMYHENPEGCHYLVASRCHRSMFAHLKNRSVYLWHMWESDLTKKPYKGEPAFICGATVVLSAIPLAMTMGLKHFHFFGFDSSFPSFDKHHAYPQPEFSQQISVRIGDPVNGREFKTTATWAGQAQQYQEMRKNWGHLWQSTVYGDGMIAEIERIGRPS